jgi:hypothetical protein
VSPDAIGTLDEETLNLLLLLKQTFPRWDITYSTTTRCWIARSRRRPLCRKSPAALCIGLILTERRARQTRLGFVWAAIRICSLATTRKTLWQRVSGSVRRCSRT